MKTIKIDKFTIQEIAKNISEVYHFSPERIYNVILQVQSLDKTLDIIETCSKMNMSLDYGVYCFLKYKDENRSSILLEITNEQTNSRSL